MKQKELNLHFPEMELPPVLDIVSLTGGANNQTYRLIFEDEKSVVLKHYFHDPKDPRDRLGTEYAFLEYGRSAKIDSIPVPLAKNPPHHTALYSYIKGSGATIEAISEKRIDDVLYFLEELNREKKRGEHLPLASESSFSFTQYIEKIDHRIEQLRQSPRELPIEIDMHRFLKEELIAEWEKEKSILLKKERGKIPREDCIISPSDIGFHNTLFSDEKTYFLDFEYAGWDDPAKTACDLIFQPRFPLEKKYYPKIAEHFAKLSQNSQRTEERIYSLLNLTRIKWTAIILNVFQREGKKRRAFSIQTNESLLEMQLQKAKSYFRKR